MGWPATTARTATRRRRRQRRADMPETSSPAEAASRDTDQPTIIQGGMGVGISGWRLARAVSMAGQLGVVSGTALDAVMARRLQTGDPGGHMRRALAQLPLPGVAQRIIDKYFVEGGKAAGKPFRAKPMPGERLSKHHA